MSNTHVNLAARALRVGISVRETKDDDNADEMFRLSSELHK